MEEAPFTLQPRLIDVYMSDHENDSERRIGKSIGSCSSPFAVLLS